VEGEAVRTFRERMLFNKVVWLWTSSALLAVALGAFLVGVLYVP
jgi:hypothetical protein